MTHPKRDFAADPATKPNMDEILGGRRMRRNRRAEWSRRLMEVLPEDFRSNPVSPEQLATVNEAFLTLILHQARENDMAGLYKSYYDMNRWLIETDCCAANIGEVWRLSDRLARHYPIRCDG